MTKFTNLAGQRFGRWLVIERAKNTSGYKVKWLCKCDCGNYKTITTDSLKSGNSRSCGCLAQELRAEKSGVLIKCEFCGKSFKVSPSRVVKIKYCSSECFDKTREKKCVKKICERCGKIFYVSSSTDKKGKVRFCRESCKYPPKIKKICATCGKPYYVTATRDNSNYCSRECRTLRVENQCYFCKKIFYTRPSETHKFCSNECSASAKKNRIIRVCKRCGKQFEKTIYHDSIGRGIYCSNKCKFPPQIKKFCKVCGKEFYVSEFYLDKKFCSKECVSISYKHSIDYMRKIAIERNGKCLSNEYTNARTPLKWQCSKGHVWEAIPYSILRGTWCKACVIRDVSISDMHKMAEERGGKCLSIEYKTMRSKIVWECSLGHKFEATPDHIMRGRWCPQCSAGLGERICRAFFEQLFNAKFPKCRPSWLISNNGGRLELDGYSRKLKLAFEHQGIQHYRRIKYFQKDDESLINQQIRDQEKLLLCNYHGIKLITVPQIPDLLHVDEVADYIKDKCIHLDVKIPSSFDSLEVQLKDAYSTLNSLIDLESINSIAESKGGKCLSNNYVNNTTKLCFECAEGHKWKTSPAAIKAGRWCPECAGLKKPEIKTYKKIAEERGGSCLSDKYINAKTKLLFECERFHKWEALPCSVKRGSWCPICAKIDRKN